ncbi:hypothetical protein PF008_g21662 [Phytophthora fragariae]|uniref:Uncharacterized protein n=2 Tax=Phytophthora fragariae TaxID=53985 RepID=A0A6G0QW39_9STRA|nr:hypothetical protein PF008_g21662 [Phytophthora fragariae]
MSTVRLVCAQFPPYTRCLWHQHLKYGIYVVMAPLDVVEQPYGQEPRPLVQDKGAVFCRDHTKDKLIHAATTAELPAFLVEVELLKEKVDIVPNDNLPLHAGRGVDLLNKERECRVYRFTMQQNEDNDNAAAEISLELQTEAVLLVLDDCTVEITNESSGKQENTVRQLSLQVGDDVQLTAGKFGIKLESSSVEKTQFVLAEIY